MLRFMSGWVSVRGRDVRSYAGGLLLGFANLRFGPQPVGKFRAGFAAALEIAFVGSESDLFLYGEFFDQGFRCTCGHGNHLLRSE
jgi:hypothetical protein